ncbi:MAG: acylneuraminate cytidylyltransferase family protein [Syntrophorhabdaceae bacterium]|nr:acylneuraminate cytidylyltransferase family protein [Syntrophorhabdaceae bacterium]MDD5244571.1 acylneuraminate cytidylyltransferase family protein [Syntrophorhabdaceae bacterium]
MNIAALIPARSGSKRVPLKNIKPLYGKPLMAYTIEAAKRSRFIKRIIVSTDSSDISDIAKQYGAEVPFLRPEEISTADSTELEFFDHALDWLEKNEGYIPDIIVLLYPTSPFRKTESIDRAIETIMDHPECDSLRSVRKCSEHPCKMWTIANGCLRPFVDSGKASGMHTLSYHLLPDVYVQNASIYIVRVSTIKNKRSTTGDIIIPFIMDEVESIDINNPLDFLLAETAIKDKVVCCGD